MDLTRIMSPCRHAIDCLVDKDQVGDLAIWWSICYAMLYTGVCIRRRDNMVGKIVG